MSEKILSDGKSPENLGELIKRFSSIKETCNLVHKGEISIGVGRIDRCGAYISRVPCVPEKCPKTEERDSE